VQGGGSEPEARWRAASARAVEMLDEGVLLLDRGGAILGANRAAEALFGRAAGELAGHALGDLLAPAAAPVVVERLGQLTAPGAVTLAAIGRRADGGEIPLELRLARGADDGEGWVSATVTPPSDRRRLHDELRDSQAFLANVINTLADPVFVKDEQHRWVVVNEAFCRFMGRARAELMGKSDYDFFPAAEAAVFWEKDALVFDSGVTHENEESFTDSAGETHIIATKKAVFADGVGKKVLVGVIRDVTARKRGEEDVRRAKEAAESASRAKTDFLANMSHELRTPLNSVLGFARVVEGGAYGALNERQRHFLGNIVRSSEHMLSLINDLLDLRRVEENRMELTFVELAVRPLLEEAVSLVHPVIAERKHTVAIDVLDAPRVRCDQRALLQVLVNLITNAAKFTPPGGSIQVRAAATPGAVRIEVADNGVGISAEDQGKLFEYFSQVGSKHVHRMKGSGVGLALTKALVERLGGAIDVVSAPGAGSTFRFTVAAAPDAAAGAGEGEGAPGGATWAGGAA
jgi:PAS domain S-box-containing protein